MAQCHGKFQAFSNVDILRANEACQDEMRRALDRQMLLAARSIPKLKPGSGTGPAVEAVVRRVVLPRRERQSHQGVPDPLAGKSPAHGTPFQGESFDGTGGQAQATARPTCRGNPAGRATGRPSHRDTRQDPRGNGAAQASCSSSVGPAQLTTA